MNYRLLVLSFPLQLHGTRRHTHTDLFGFQREKKEAPEVAGALIDLAGAYLTQSDLIVVLQKSIPTQIRQLILYISDSQG